MPVPQAIVAVDIRKVAGIPSSLLLGTLRPYAIARVAGRFIGRSRLIPSGTADFDLAPEPSLWQHEYATVGEAVTVDVEIWDDRGDAAPRRLATVSGSIASPWPSGPLVIGSSPEVQCQVSTRPVPRAPSRVPVPRSVTGSRGAVTLAVPNSVVVELTEIGGLYRPGYVPTGITAPRHAEPQPGYRSEDDRGRIFLNHGLDGRWAKNSQLIQLSARVNVVRGRLPAGAKLKWKVVDPDDPFNDQVDVHQQWGPYVDDRDYSAAAGRPQTGARGGDNEGTPDHSPAWEQVGAFALTVASATEATTSIVRGESKVKLHCPNVAGDNLVVRAEIDSSSPLEVFAAQTGIMTVWHRLDVENVRMTSALALPVADVPAMFEQACVQLDFAPERVVPDRQFMAPDDRGLGTASATYVNASFSHRADPGWFCVFAAMEPHPLPSARGAQLFHGTVAIHHGGTGADQGDYIEIPGSHADADYVTFRWGSPSQEVGFQVNENATQVIAGPRTRIWLDPHDVQDQFTAGDGSILHAYATSLYFYPRGRLDGTTWAAPGYGIPASCEVTVESPGAFYTSGISPSVTAGGRDYFAGRTIVFTHHGAYRDPRTGTARPNYNDRVVTVIAHELVHAFGMPHKCGYWDHRTPREKTCHMNYSPNWMIDDTRRLTPGSSDKVGRNMCGRHLKEVRRVHLEDNGGLRW